MQLSDIKNVSIIGAGTMGHGFALIYALGGYNVTLNDRNDTILSNAMRRIGDDLRTMADGKLVPPDEVAGTIARITPTASLKEAVKNADFVTEAITEDTTTKKKLFTELDNICPPHAILASNTSSLVLEDYTGQIKRRDKAVITHWVNPPHLVPVVEVLGNAATSEETVQLAMALLKKIKKVPVRLNKAVPGFVINRLQYALLREIWSLWQQGVASAEDLDTIMKGSLGFRWAAIGPIQTSDLGGLDVFYAVSKNLFPVISDAHEAPPELKKLVDEGKLGLKSGEGFFKYSVSATKGQDEVVKTRDQKHMQLLKIYYP